MLDKRPGMFRSWPQVLAVLALALFIDLGLLAMVVALVRLLTS